MKRVAIIGGGIAGLSAAFLAQGWGRFVQVAARRRLGRPDLRSGDDEPGSAPEESDRGGPINYSDAD